MKLRKILVFGAVAALLSLSCSDDDEGQTTPDKGVPDKGASKDGSGDGSSGDAKKGDAAKSTTPVIEKMIPSDGLANGGKTGKGTMVLLTGKNFKQGATIYFDGAPQALVVSVASAVARVAAGSWPWQPTSAEWAARAHVAANAAAWRRDTWRGRRPHIGGDHSSGKRGGLC